MTLPVFIAPEAAALQGCTRGGSYTLDGDEGFHAATVRRMDVGQMLDVVDGDGLRVRGSVSERTKKWESTLRSATKQSRRAFIPRLEDACTSQRLAQWMSEETASGAWVIVCHESTRAPLSLLLRELRAAAEKSLPTTDEASGQTVPGTCLPPRISVVVGPEGGVDPDELSLFEAAGARVCLLGTTVLRASTAGPVALSLISDAIGRW